MSEDYILDEPYATEMKGCLVSTKDYINILRNKCRDLQQKVEQLEKENQKLKEDNIFLKTNLTKLSSKYIKNDLLNILNKGDNKE